MSIPFSFFVCYYEAAKEKILQNAKGGEAMKRIGNNKLLKDLKRNYALYIRVFPVVVYYFVFHYLPMGGLVMAFQNFKPKLGIFGSPFVGNTGVLFHCGFA